MEPQLLARLSATVHGMPSSSTSCRHSKVVLVGVKTMTNDSPAGETRKGGQGQPVHRRQHAHLPSGCSLSRCHSDTFYAEFTNTDMLCLNQTRATHLLPLQLVRVHPVPFLCGKVIVIIAL